MHVEKKKQGGPKGNASDLYSGGAQFKLGWIDGGFSWFSSDHSVK